MMIFKMRVFRPNLLDSSFASCSFINPDFLVPQSAYFDCTIDIPFLVWKIFEFKFKYFFYTLHNKFAGSFITSDSKKQKVNF